MADGISISSEQKDGKTTFAQLDVHNPQGAVTVEWDKKRRVLYVHMEGHTVLRMCRVEELRIEQ